jgi:putative ATPase
MMFTPSLFPPDPVMVPLPERLRPQVLADIIGQEHLTAPDAPLARLLAAGKLTSCILWGPPGCGKTTLARVAAHSQHAVFVSLSAIFSGVADLKKIFAEAEQRQRTGGRTVLFVDEIHRFNRAQQDAFLPHLETGAVILIGATTENPSFELNAALLSRCQVFVLRPLATGALERMLSRAEQALGQRMPLDAAARQELVAMADGDGRALLGLVESLVELQHSAQDSRKNSLQNQAQDQKQDQVQDLAQDQTQAPLTPAALHALLSRRALRYDKNRDEHYNLISALHKSLRGSDADAALYWLARMVAGGEDMAYLTRRLIRFATEDIGLADPQALPLALAACEAWARLGSPEGELAVAGLVVYLATAPKSNSVYAAWKAAQATARATGSLSPPRHILNAPTALMRQEGYGAGYAYDHDTPEGFSGQNSFPAGLARTVFYHPAERGFERDIARRLAYWERLRQQKQAAGESPPVVS